MLGHWWVDPKELDDQQLEALSLAEDKSHLIVGPPGSGKTNLLVLRATQIIRGTTPNVRLLVFNRTLEEFISNNPTTYALSKEHISTLVRWEMETIVRLGGVPVTVGNFEAKRQGNLELLQGLCAKKKVGNLHDLILLDEVQDYTPEEIALVMRLGKQVFAAGDDRQGIYDHDSPMTLLESECNRHELSFHYRNGRHICELADQVGKVWSDYKSMCDNSQYNERSNPSTVTRVASADIADQAEKIVVSLRTQLTAYPNEMLGVICPLRRDIRAIRDYINTTDLAPQVVYQVSDEGYVPFDPKSRICLTTVHSAKGLEFRAAHLAGTDEFYKFRDRQWKMAYTAITRAKTSLSIYDGDRMPDFLDGALAAIAPKKKLKVEDLFK